MDLALDQPWLELSSALMVGHPPVGEKHQQNVWYIQWLRPSLGSTFCELTLRASHPVRRRTWQTTWHHVDAMWLKRPHGPFSYDFPGNATILLIVILISGFLNLLASSAKWAARLQAPIVFRGRCKLRRLS